MRGETMRLVLVMGFMLVLAGVAMLFPAELVDLISRVEDWFEE
jgi:hypothetical protein